MGATYTRQSTYADGDTINADDTNDEFDQLLAAFAASSGHTHDGTTAEGGPVTKLLGNTLTFGAATAGTDITITFDGETNDGVLKWMEDEDYFEFSDDILIALAEKLQFRDTGIYIHSSTNGQLDVIADGEVQIASPIVDINASTGITLDGANLNSAWTVNTNNKIQWRDTGLYIHSSTDGQLDIVADTEIQIAATTVDINGNVDVSGTLAVAGVLTGASLDISGDIDIDGTTNLDVVDIDGAVDMASTLQVDGAITNSSTIVSAGKITADAGIDIDNINIDGTTIALSSGTLLLDVAADITLDADGGDIFLKDGGTLFATFNSGGASDLNILSGSTQAIALSGANATFSGSITATELDISGDIDVDGTTNLDVVDIDGAVDMASTLQVDGVATFTGRDIHSGGITIANAGQIGSVGDADAIAIASDGVVTLTQKLIGTELDISGNIDVDGTTNLDNTDIDGTLVVDGSNISLDSTSTLNIDNSNTTNGITIGTATSGVPVSIGHTTSEVTFGDNVTVTGDFTVNGTTTTVATTNMVVADNLIELNNGASSNANDSGIVIERGSTGDNAIFMWDESADTFVLGTTTATGASTGNLSVTDGALQAGSLDISGNIDVDGTANLDVVDIDGAVNMATTALVTGVLTTTATQVATGGITSGSNIVSDTDSTDDLGTTGVRWANLFVDGITATDQITATGFTGTLDGILGSGAAAAATVTTLDTSGAVNLNLVTDSTSSTSGALIVDGGVGVAKKLFVGTDLDVAGNAVIDGTALVTGVLTTTAATVFNGGFAANDGSTITTDDNSYNLQLISTDANTGAGPLLSLHRQSASPADNDTIGGIQFRFNDDAGEGVTGHNTIAQIVDASNGTEDCHIIEQLMIGGSAVETVRYTPTGTVFNEQSNDLDFRVESNGNANMVFVDGGNDKVAIGTATATATLTVEGSAVAKTDTDTSNTGSVTLDFAANQNFVLTLTGNVTLANPTTEQVGQSGFITLIQDGTGGRTLSLGTDYETAGGAGITLTATASATDIVPYVVSAAGRILLGAPQLAFS